MARRRKNSPDGFRLLVLASGLALLLWFVPFADVVVYPIRILVTILHEASHAVMAWVTGGTVSSIRVNHDGSGLTATRGGIPLLISSAGYMGTMASGVLLILLCQKPRRARLALAATALSLGVISLGLIRPLWSAGFLVGLGMSIVGMGMATVASPRGIQFTVGFLGVESCLNALFDLKVLVSLSTATGVRTDARNLQEITHIPALVWAVAWSIGALVLLILALRRLRPAWW